MQEPEDTVTISLKVTLTNLISPGKIPAPVHAISEPKSRWPQALNSLLKLSPICHLHLPPTEREEETLTTSVWIGMRESRLGNSVRSGGPFLPNTSQAAPPVLPSLPRP